MRSENAVPRILLSLVAIAVICTTITQMMLSPSFLSTSIDEDVHVNRMATWFQTGWYLPSQFMDPDGNPKDSLVKGRLHVYGPAWSITAHALNAVRGVEEWGAPRRGSSSSEGRNLAAILLAVSAAIAVAAAVTMIAPTSLALWAGAAVLAIPAWAGYGMFHPKDVPVGAGYTMFSAGLVIALLSKSHKSALVAALFCALGVFYGVGTRTAMWVPFFGTFLFFICMALTRSTSKLHTLLPAIVGVVAGTAAMAALEYRHVTNAYDWFIGSVLYSGEFPGRRLTLTAGQMLSSLNTPWWYLPAWFGTAIPLGMLMLALGGIVLLSIYVLKGPIVGLRSRLAQDESTFLIFAMQAIGLPLVAVVLGSSVYGGLRQHLYVMPAVSALASLGAAWMFTRRPTWPIALFLAAAIAIPTVEQTLLFPYNYTYRNLLASPVAGRWATEMHLVSQREAIRMVPNGANLSCMIYQRRPRNCPYTDEMGISANVLPPDDRYWLILRLSGGIKPPSDCVDHGAVSRPLRWEKLVMTRILVCDSDPRAKT